MRLSATRLRQDLYRILDSVLETGIPVEVERRGRIVKIIPQETTSKLSRLKTHDIIVGDPESLVHLDWSDEWKGDGVAP